jgi:hypothetical protein
MQENGLRKTNLDYMGRGSKALLRSCLSFLSGFQAPKTAYRRHVGAILSNALSPFAPYLGHMGAVFGYLQASLLASLSMAFGIAKPPAPA